MVIHKQCVSQNFCWISWVLQSHFLCSYVCLAVSFFSQSCLTGQESLAVLICLLFYICKLKSINDIWVNRQAKLSIFTILWGARFQMILKVFPWTVFFILKQFLKPYDDQQHCFKCTKDSYWSDEFAAKTIFCVQTYFSDLFISLTDCVSTIQNNQISMTSSSVKH